MAQAKDDNKVVAENRDTFGKGAARKIRAAGKVPAVVYGHGGKPQHITVPAHQISLILRRANAVLHLELEGKKQLVLVKDVQRDPVRQIIEHLDLIVVKKGEKVHVEVPVHLEGESFPGTISMIDVGTLRLEVEATNIPERVVVDLEGRKEGEHVYAKDVVLPEGAALIDEPDLVLVTITVPSAAAAAEESAEGEGEGAAEASAEGSSEE